MIIASMLMLWFTQMTFQLPEIYNILEDDGVF